MKGIKIYGIDDVDTEFKKLIKIFEKSENSKSQKELIKNVTEKGFWYARRFVHKDTRSLFTSITKKDDIWKGIIFLDKSVKNPKSKTKPYVYGFYENRRGGSHAFMDNTRKYTQDNLKKAMVELYE
jgi:hypothetical protein